MKHVLYAADEACFTSPVSGSASDNDSTARELLMDTAETLIAERGMGVSLREIAARAGQRNNSAVISN